MKERRFNYIPSLVNFFATKTGALDGQTFVMTALRRASPVNSNRSHLFCSGPPRHFSRSTWSSGSWNLVRERKLEGGKRRTSCWALWISLGSCSESWFMTTLTTAMPPLNEWSFLWIQISLHLMSWHVHNVITCPQCSMNIFAIFQKRNPRGLLLIEIYFRSFIFGH